MRRWYTLCDLFICTVLMHVTASPQLLFSTSTRVIRRRNWSPVKPGGICSTPQLGAALPSSLPTPQHPPMERRSSLLASRPEKWQLDMLMFRFTVWLNEDAVSCLYRVTLPCQLCFRSNGERESWEKDFIPTNPHSQFTVKVLTHWAC